MIFDTIKNASLYYGLSKQMDAGLKWLQENDATKLDPGKYEIMGSDCFAIVMTYDSKPLDQAAWEAHRKYYDIQFIAEGAEKMGYANIEGMKTTVEYDETKDAMLLSGDGDFFTMPTGTFAIFGPQDVHMPMIAVTSPAPVKKVVVKVKA